MKLREPPGFILDLITDRLRKRLERLDLDAPALIAPGSSDGAIDQEGRHGVWRLRIEDQRPVPLRQDLGAPGMDQLQNCDGAYCLGTFRLGHLKQDCLHSCNEHATSYGIAG